MKATTSKDQIPLIYAKVYVTNRELPYATMTAIRRNDSEESVRDRFLARFPNLVRVTPVYIPDDEREWIDDDEVFVDEAIFV